MAVLSQHFSPRPLALPLALLCTCLAAQAGGGPFGIDHRLNYDASGFWSRNKQLALEYGVIGVEVLGATWLGNDDEMGHVLWQTIDAGTVSALAGAGLKIAFSRARPSSGQGPDQWFQGKGNRSFPSGEVALQASFVTPLIAHYAARDPWIWALEALPLYDGIARMKSQAHWQTDVLAGWALGSALGYWASTRETPLSVQVLPHGMSIGYSKKF